MLLIPFAVTAFLIEVTPGPNMGYLALVSAQRGRTAGFAAVAGVALGLAILGSILCVGLAFLSKNPDFHLALGWLGAAYMAWLAYDAWKEAERPVDMPAAGTLWTFFRQGLIANLLNAKAALFFIAVLPSFVETIPARATQILALIALYVTIATAVHSLVVGFASLLQHRFADPRSRRWSGRIAALLLAGISVWMISDLVL